MKVIKISGIKGCYGPRLKISKDAPDFVKMFFKYASIWNGHTDSDDEYLTFEFTEEDFNSSLFKQIYRRCKLPEIMMPEIK